MLHRKEASTEALRSLSSPQKDIAAISAHQRLPGMQELCSAPVNHRKGNLVMTDVEHNSSVIKTWKEQSYRSGANVVLHKVVLARQIMWVLRNRKAWSFLSWRSPRGKYRGHDFTGVQQKDKFLYEIFYRGFPDPGMLQRGNRLVVVGTTDGASEETIGPGAKVLPHLLEQRLHVWQIDEFEANRLPYGDTAGYFPLESMYCDEKMGSSLPAG